MEHNHKPEGEHAEEGMTANVVVEKKDRFLPISIMVAAILIGGALVFTALYKGGDAGGTPQIGGAAVPPAAAPTNTNLMAIGSHDAVLGSASAPVTIVEYGDYQCPFCSQFFAQTQPLLISNYVQSGKVKMVFRDFPFLGAESTVAANAAQCANDQGKLWAYHDALYGAKLKDEQNGGGENDGFYSVAKLLQLGQQVGVNMTTFTACVNGNKDGAIVAQEKSDAIAGGVNSTPSFYVNGTQILGAQPFAQFQAAISTALAK